MEYYIDRSTDVPIYTQIVQQIRTAIQEGVLLSGERLPTVRQLSNRLKISQGTIKHAYDELEKLGVITMSQGRGTFVASPDGSQTTGKKRYAFLVLDRMFDELAALGLTAKEMELYFMLRMRERLEMQNQLVRLVIIHRTPEALALIYRQLSGISNLDVSEALFEDVLASPERIRERFDIIVTTPGLYRTLVEQFYEERQKITRIVFSLSQPTIMALSRIQPTDHVGIYCESAGFARIIQKGCEDFQNIGSNISGILWEDQRELTRFLADKDVLIVPVNCLTSVGSSQRIAIQQFEESGKRLIFYDYHMDQGSFMYLEEQVQAISRKMQKHDSF